MRTPSRPTQPARCDARSHLDLVTGARSSTPHNPLTTGSRRRYVHYRQDPADVVSIVRADANRRARPSVTFTVTFSDALAACSNAYFRAHERTGVTVASVTRRLGSGAPRAPSRSTPRHLRRHDPHSTGHHRRHDHRPLPAPHHHHVQPVVRSTHDRKLAPSRHLDQRSRHFPHGRGLDHWPVTFSRRGSPQSTLATSRWRPPASRELRSPRHRQRPRRTTVHREQRQQRRTPGLNLSPTNDSIIDVDGSRPLCVPGRRQPQNFITGQVYTITTPRRTSSSSIAQFEPIRPRRKPSTFPVTFDAA